MDWETIIKDQGVTIAFPKKFVQVLQMFQERGFIILERAELFHVISPTSYSVTRTQTGLSPKDFLEFYGSLKVSNGFKTLETADEIIHIKPKRPLKMSFKVSAPERRLVEFAARQYLLDVSDYIRMCVMDNAIKTFIRASKQKETGLV